ncbi:dTDP-4-dehydrorhamnose 3,5-epimerase [Kamptonema cortianum]|nr:dTDP-4-dehydrorhamnose 3,5-epimerase [Kamptonema cortianum]
MSKLTLIDSSVIVAGGIIRTTGVSSAMSASPQVAPHIQALSQIEGVFLAPIVSFADERGRFMETFRRDWFPWVNWDSMQANRSESKANVLRGLHYHHRQIDYWHVVSGVVRVGLADLRPTSPTYRATHTLEIGDNNNIGVFIPVGVAHGFYAVTNAVLTYLVNNYYDGSDENGVAWDDPDLGIDWGVSSPLLSQRDQRNPRLRDISPENLPR